MKIFKLLLVFSMFTPLLANAGDIIKGAKITMVTSTSANTDQFAIKTSGGSGPCVGKSIMFTAADSGSLEVFNKAYSAALAAFAGDFTIDVHNYHNNACRRASSIRLSK